LSTRKAAGKSKTTQAAGSNVMTQLASAVALHQSGKFAEAEVIYRKVLQAIPQQPDALHLLGLVEKQKGHLAEAIRLIEQAAQLSPDSASVHSNLGNAYRDSGFIDRAMRSYERALALQPVFPDCLNNYGNALKDVGDYEGAVEKYLAALKMQPDNADVHNNLGGAYHKLGRLTEAAQHYQKAISLKPGYAMAHYNLGNALVDAADLPKAIEHFRASVRHDPNYVEAYNSLLRQLQTTCDWRETAAFEQKLHEFGTKTGKGTVFPFAFVAIPGTPADHQQCARLWAQYQYRPYREYQAQHPFSFEGRSHRRLRIGYLSSDLHNHATAYLMAEVFELHDREKFEVYAFSLGPDDGKDMRQRLIKGFEHFIDLRGKTFHESAQRIHAEEIDILVDLKGYTKDTGSPILAFRPAPIQVNHLGYPGTMGADFVDYILTDRFVTPPEAAPFYDEKFAYLPDCYQPNDRQRRIAAAPTRADCGLPEDAVVFCCFNHNYKLTPMMFSAWCRMLQAVPNSVLWLLKSNPWAQENLKREAADRGIDPERILFAGEQPLEAHLARLQLADIFLDTLPYNAHTTASDALWACVPVVTLVGETFPSRVAGSLLRAARLPQLITSTLNDYEALGIRLASHPDELAALKRHLRENRLNLPLFDSLKFTRNLEALYVQMWQRYQAGEAPAQIEADVAVAQPEKAPALPINIVHIWHDKHKPIFEVLIAQIEAALRDNGVLFTRSENTLAENAVNLLVGSTIFITDKLREEAKGKHYVVYQMEQLADRKGTFRPRANYLALLKEADWVWDYSAGNVAAMKKQGITQVSHVAVGYHSVLERFTHTVPKDIDVLFYGSLTERREKVVLELQKRGVNVLTSFAQYGKTLDALIERSKIILNAHQFDNVDTLEEVRLSYLLSNRCFVVSEDADHNPYGDGVVFCSYKKLADTCVEYLKADAATRQAIADKGYQAIKRLDYTGIVKNALSDMAQTLPVARAEPVAKGACIFSLCWLDGVDGYGQVAPGVDGKPPTRLARTIKWLDYYAPLLNSLNAEKIVFIDDASDMNAVRALGGNIYSPDFVLLEPATTRPYLDIIRFNQHLPRKSVKDYPYFWRGIGMIPPVIEQYRVDKVIFIESDCYLLTPRIVDFIRNLNQGFCAFWAPRYNCPESALSVLCRDQFKMFEEFSGPGAYEKYNEQPAELVLPFTHFVNQGFNGDRFGEDALPQAVDMDFYAQCPVPVRMTYNLKESLRFNIVLIGINDHKAIFEDLIIGMQAAFTDLGVACTRTENAFLNGAINLLIGSVNFASEMVLESLKDKPYILYQMEQLASDRGHLPKYPHYAELMRQALCIWDYSKTNIERLQEMGISGAIHVPAGYHKALEVMRQDVPKDIDVLFYGTLSPRRDRILKALAERGVGVKVAFGVYGEARNALIERSRIIINIHCDEIDTLEEVRLSYLLANHCFIVSENSAQNPYGDGVVYCAYEELADTCVKYLQAGDEVRREIAVKGYQAVRALDDTTIIKAALQHMTDLFPTPKPEQMTAQPATVAASAPAPAYYSYPRPEVVALVQMDAKVILDIGCGAGMLGKSIKERQPCHVTGIELMPEVAAQAATVLDKVLPGDVFKALPTLPDAHFDTIIMADVLEHVADTDGMLQLARQKLKPTGKLVLSLPNVRHWSVLKGLLEGRWEYQAQGILDRTHLKFFTKSSAIATLARTGFKVEQVFATAMKGETPPAGLGAVLKTFGIEALDLEEGAMHFQYLFVCSQ